MNIYRSILVLWLMAAASAGLSAQSTRSQEVSEYDGIPVIMKHLPDWENVRPNAVFIGNQGDLRTTIGDHEILDTIEFTGGTEAASAKYPAGRLLIVEYTNPQAASDADKNINEALIASAQPGIIYRRIGNYAAFVFDASDESSANALLDQVKYEKSVQWLGKDPYYFEKLEAAFVSTTTTMLVGSVVLVVGGVLSSVILGLIVGFVYFRIRERQRTAWTAYSDSGGLTRLNLDELSEPALQK